MRRTLREWEKLWRERWDLDDNIELDHVFDLTDDVAETICEAEVYIGTQTGRIEVVGISLFDADTGTVLVSYQYTTLEPDLAGLVRAVVASITDDPEDEAPPEDKEDREEYQLG